MRQRHIRNRQQLIDDFGSYIVEDPAAAKGRWAELFGNDRPVKLEIGSGKGAFITGMCLKYPDTDFIACEGGYNVYPRILQRAAGFDVQNLLVLARYITDPCEFFAEDELSGIYLNFSDPWKKKYKSRRLTYRDKIEGYRRICRPGSALEFKTDTGFAVMVSGAIERFFRQMLDLEAIEDTLAPFQVRNLQMFKRNWTTNEMRTARFRFMNLRERAVSSGGEAVEELIVTEIIRACTRRIR